MNNTTPQVDGYIRKNKKWQKELEALRAIVLECSLVEEVKWRAPCYTFEGRNVVLLGALKDCCVLSFMKGALLKDTKGVLEKPGENTQAGRVIRLASVQEIDAMKTTLKAYVKEAIKVEKSGLKVDFKKSPEPMPEELVAALDENPALKKAFEALTPGRQRGYILHFSSAKQSKTRVSRIEKCTPQILEGIGLNDWKAK